MKIFIMYTLLSLIFSMYKAARNEKFVRANLDTSNKFILLNRDIWVGSKIQNLVMQPEQYAQKWFCDCEKHCKGRTKVVSRSTFQRHAQFRKPAFPNESGCGQSLPAPPHVASATATGEPGLSPQGTRESARAQAVASAIGMSAPV